MSVDPEEARGVRDGGEEPVVGVDREPRLPDEPVHGRPLLAAREHRRELPQPGRVEEQLLLHTGGVSQREPRGRATASEGLEAGHLQDPRGVEHHDQQDIETIWSGSAPGEFYVRANVTDIAAYTPNVNDPVFLFSGVRLTSYLMRCEDQAFSPASPRPILSCEPIATMDDLLRAAAAGVPVDIPRPEPRPPLEPAGSGLPADPVTGIK